MIQAREGYTTMAATNRANATARATQASIRSGQAVDDDAARTGAKVAPRCWKGKYSTSERSLPGTAEDVKDQPMPGGRKVAPVPETGSAAIVNEAA
jgi:hypothetical protein